MPPTITAIRRILEGDRVWCAYALGDLEFADQCEWLVDEGPPEALVLLFRAFERPILFAHGPVGALTSLIGRIGAPYVAIQVRPEALPAIETRYLVSAPRRMWRMVLDEECQMPAASAVAHVSPLGRPDLRALRTLYTDGVPRGEAPDCFHDAMLDGGIYKGVWLGDRLIAAAGTHLLSSAESVAAIGNVYTRRDQRGRGLGELVTYAVALEARTRGFSTLVLNVAQDGFAVRMYERIGFRRHCELVEGRAVRKEMRASGSALIRRDT